MYLWMPGRMLDIDLPNICCDTLQVSRPRSMESKMSPRTSTKL